MKTVKLEVLLDNHVTESDIKDMVDGLREWFAVKTPGYVELTWIPEQES